MSTIEANKMRRSARLTEEQAIIKDEILEEPKAKKNRPDDRNTNIAALDNVTMVEAFKYLNYRQLGKNSLVSKWFSNVIRTHRHKLARLFVHSISMSSNRYCDPSAVKIFSQKLSPQAYNKWIISNQYSKQIQLENQVAGIQNAQDVPKVYALRAYASYKDPHHRQPYSSMSSDSESSSSGLESSSSDSESRKGDSDDSTCVFVANAALNQKNWPLFQHFVCLLTDPFIYIHSMELFSENNVLNLLTGAIEPDHSRLKCEHLIFCVDGNVQKFMSWIKGHMRCNKVQFDTQFGYRPPNHSKPLLDFFATGSHCTSAIQTSGSTANLLKVVNNFVQKFIDLKYSDEFQVVESIQGSVAEKSVGTLQRNYAKFIVKEETDGDQPGVKLAFEFVNNDVKKKLELILSYPRIMSYMLYYSLKIKNL